MPETIFFNIWRTNSPKNQQALLDEMRAEAPALAAQPGFLGLSIWAANDGKRVIVEGRWASEEHFHAAVTANPEAQSARTRLESYGQPEPGLFAESFRIGSRSVADGREDSIVFIQTWDVGTADRQQAWLGAMRQRVGALTGKPGFEQLRTHASLDGRRIVVYAQWGDPASVDAAASSPEAKAGHQALREHGTPDGALYRLANVYWPEPTHRLREEASARWESLGFRTSVVTLDEVELFTVTAGSGAPVVLLHGYPQSGEIWRFVAPALVKTRQVIIPDLPGMGLSGIPRHGCDLPSVSQDLHRLLSALNVSGVDIVAHDWGGAVGALYALRHQSNVRCFAFIESALGGAGFESL